MTCLRAIRSPRVPLVWRTASPALAAATLTLVLGALGAASAQTLATEDQVKAAYLYNFANFGAWPPAAFESPTSPFRICTLGHDAVGRALPETLRSDSVGAHPLILVREPPAGERRACHIVFVSIAGSRVAALLKKLPVPPS